MAFHDKLARVKMLVCSVDGVLTDGTVTYGNDTDIRTFHILDGLATRLASWNDFPVAWISARMMRPVNRRGDDINVKVYSGIADKEVGLRLAARDADVALADIAFVGYDLNDIPALRLAGLPMAVQGAVPEVAALAEYVTELSGGQGAIREVVEMIFKSQGRWESAIEYYLNCLRNPQLGMIAVNTEL